MHEHLLARTYIHVTCELMYISHMYLIYLDQNVLRKHWEFLKYLYLGVKKSMDTYHHHKMPPFGGTAVHGLTLTVVKCKIVDM